MADLSWLPGWVPVYVSELAELIGLRDWEIVLRSEPASTNSAGNIEVIYGQRRAFMRLADDFGEWSGEKQRDTVVHELLHCHLHNVWDTYESLSDFVAAPVHQLANKFIVRDIEFAVDAITGAWCRMLPLPPVEGKP